MKKSSRKSSLIKNFQFILDFSEQKRRFPTETVRVEHGLHFTIQVHKNHLMQEIHMKI